MSTASSLAQITHRCIHKLPTACRLTATQNCCACSDRRPHSAAYSVYIDGTGVANRGTRWERYCWPCKEFWTTRLAASNPPLRSTQTRIPEIPDQTDFLRTWYDVQQGYRIIVNESGAEERIPLHLSVQDLNPGRLPAPYDDLPTPEILDIDSPLSSLDSDEFSESHSHPNIQPFATHQQIPQTSEEREREVEYQTRRVSQLRSELLHIRVELGRVVLDLEALGSGMDSRSPMSPIQNGTTNGTMPNDGPAQGGARDMQVQTEEERRRMDQIRQGGEGTSPTNGRRPGSDHHNHIANRDAHMRLLAHRYQDRQREYQNARRDLNHARSESRSAQNISNVFGSREEVLGDDYQSPVGNLFMSAYGAYGRPEDHRRAAQQQAALDAQHGYPPITPSGQPSEMWETLNATMGDPTVPGSSNSHASIFGPPRGDQGPGSPRFTPGSNVPGSMSAFLPSTYTPYIPGTSPYSLPPLASHYGTNYGGPPSATSPSIYNGQTPNTDFNPERAFYDRVNRPYGGREVGPAATTHVPSYPRPPDLRGPREYTSPRTTAAQHYNHRLERRQRAAHDAESLVDYTEHQYDLLDEMEYEDHLRDHPRPNENSVKGLDNGNDGRPEPKTEEEMKIKLECKVCFSQLVDTVLLPCGHAVMCQWCANQHVPTQKIGDRTRPIRAAKCPMCRKQIKQKVKMHIG